MKDLKRISLCDGAELLYLPDERYKTSRVTVSFMVPLKRETASAYAVVPGLLTRACSACPDFTSLNRRLAMLYGAWTGGYVRKVGEAQILSVTLSMIDERYTPDGERVTDRGVSLLRELIFRPVLEGNAFRNEDFEQERRQLCEELDSEFNEKRIYARRRCEELLCEGEPYAVGRLGTKEQLLSLTPERAYDAYRELLRGARIRIHVVGTQRVFESALAFSEELKALGGRSAAACVTRRSPSQPLRRETARSELSQCKLVLGFRSGVMEPEGQTMAMRLMCALFGGTPHSRLFMNVREKMSLCYYCSSQFMRSKGILFVESGVEEQNAARAEEEILRQLSLIQGGSFTDEELEIARRSVDDSFRTILDSPAGMDEWLLQQCMLETPLLPEEAAERLRGVSRGEVIAAANGLKLGAVFLLSGKKEEDQ